MSNQTPTSEPTQADWNREFTETMKAMERALQRVSDANVLMHVRLEMLEKRITALEGERSK